MEKGNLPGKWDKVKDKVHHRWDKITDTELDQIGGSRVELMNRIMDHYDMDESKAEQAVKDFERTLEKLDI
ncbi:MAG: CsbD family protein [bacterium]